MNIIIHKNDAVSIAEVCSDKVIINDVQDALDLMADVSQSGLNKMIIHEKNLNPEFFKLRTGIAGEILQKYVNYCMKLAIIGDFAKYESNSLKDFIYECNKGNQFCFVPDLETAKSKLT